MKTFVRAGGITAAVFAIALATASPALAHATYKSSNPPNKGTVSSPPGEITAEFTEPMTGGSYMDVTDPCGRDVGTGSEQTGSSMRVQSSGTAAGRYVVFWRAASIDGHITEGEFAFTVTQGDPCPGDEKEPKEPSERGSGGGGSGSDGGSSQNGGDGSTSVAVSGPDDDRRGGHSKDRHGKHSGMNHRGDKKSDGGAGDGPVAQGPQVDVPDAPSAIEGIPMDGLVLTLAVSALIGAAAGKIFVSLSGDDT